MFKKILLYLQKVLRYKLARPTTLKFMEGEITFRNIPKENIDQLKALILGNKTYKEDEITYGEVNSIPENASLVLNHKEETKDSFALVFDVVLELKNTAVGFRKDSSGSFHIDTVKYDVETKKAQLEKSENLGKAISIAESALKVRVVKEFL